VLVGADVMFGRTGLISIIPPAVLESASVLARDDISNGRFG
jgi:hypothetical protein